MNHTRDVELNRIGVLKRREIEARISSRLVDALSRKFDREKVLQIARETIVGIAMDQGRLLVQIGEDNSLPIIRCGPAKLDEGRCSGDRSIRAK